MAESPITVNLKSPNNLNVGCPEAKYITETLGITSPSIIYIILCIRAIQKRMKDADLVNAQYIYVYTTLCNEFEYFVDKYTPIFVKVTRGESLANFSSIFFYKNKVNNGEISEELLSKMLSEKYLTEDQRKEANAKIQEMREQGKI